MPRQFLMSGLVIPGFLICCWTLVVLLPSSVLADVSKTYGRVCDPSDLGTMQCGKNEQCVQNRTELQAECICRRGYTLNQGECLQAPSTENPTASTYTGRPNEKGNPGGTSIGLFLIVPSILISLGVLGYFGARRYKWIQRFRQIRQNRYGSVLVTRDDVDEDDHPIA